MVADTGGKEKMISEDLSKMIQAMGEAVPVKMRFVEGWRVSPRDYEILRQNVVRCDPSLVNLGSVTVIADDRVEDGKPIPIWKDDLMVQFPDLKPFGNYPLEIEEGEWKK